MIVRVSPDLRFHQWFVCILKPVSTFAITDLERRLQERPSARIFEAQRLPVAFRFIEVVHKFLKVEMRVVCNEGEYIIHVSRGTEVSLSFR